VGGVYYCKKAWGKKMDEEKAEFSIKIFQGDLDDTLDSARAATAEMRKMLPEFKKQEAIRSKMLKVKYDSLIKAGFNEDQTMWLLNNG
jgi:hypothetical protein